MAASVLDVDRLRLMTAEQGSETFSDGDLALTIERHPLMDKLGRLPVLSDGTVNPDWSATYDLAAAAAEVWEVKAGLTAAKFDVAADGQTLHLSQRYEQAMKMARYYRSRRSAKTIGLRISPIPADDGEEDE